MMPAEIHPGPSAGNGHLEPRRTTYKRGDRIVELRRCAQCGFINRDGIEETGDSVDSPGISEVVETVVNGRGTAGLPQHLRALQPAPTIVLRFGVASLQYTFPTVVAGCRFCGSLNSEGRNRSWRDYGTGVDLSNK